MSLKFKITLFILLLVALIIAPIPLPHSTHLGAVVSPDKSLELKAYWKPSGVMGLISGAEPFVYGEVVDVKTGSVVKELEIWADTPQDGIDRFKKELGWL